MSATHNYVNSPSTIDLPQPDLPSTPLLEGFEIHPLWRIEAFRVAHYHELLPLPVLDERQYDFPPALYQRMEPVLKLATLFLRIVLPDLAKVRYGRFDSEGSGFQTERTLTDHWRSTGPKLRSFERDLERMCRYYRITVIGVADERDCPQDQFELAITGSIGNDANRPLYNSVIAQSAITIDWMLFLAKEDWDIIDAAEKYRRYVLMATIFIHELAHAVWCHRMLPHLETQYRSGGRMTADRPEPRFVSMDGFRELGYAIELQLFGGLFALPHFGTPTTAERIFKTEDRLCLTLVDVDGRATEVHLLTPDTIFRLFRSETWIKSKDGKFPNFALDLLPNLRRPGRHASTILSDPPFLDADVPSIRTPRPDQLKAAITEANELF